MKYYLAVDLVDAMLGLAKRNIEQIYNKCKEEIDYLWKRADQWEYALLLVLLYTGMRINEFLGNRSENVDLDAKTICIPQDIAKNQSSIRIIPIHDKILPIVKAFKDIGSEWIAVKPNKNKINYQNFIAGGNIDGRCSIGIRYYCYFADWFDWWTDIQDVLIKTRYETILSTLRRRTLCRRHSW